MHRNAINTNGSVKKTINEKGKEIVKNSFDRMDVNAGFNCFITIKDQKKKLFESPESTSHQSSKE